MWKALSVLLAAVVLAACPPATPRPSAAALAILQGLWQDDTLSVSLIRQLADADQDTIAQSCRRLQVWDQSNDSNRVRWHESRLSLPNDPRPGPVARIWPAQGSHRNSPGALEQEGRLVAKLWVDPEYRHPDSAAAGYGYPKLGLPPGTSCLYVRKVPGQRVYRGLVIPMRDVPNQGSARRVMIDWHRYPLLNDDRAKWNYDPADDWSCSSCEKHGWCELRNLQ